MLQAHGRVELAVAHQQAGEQVEPAELLEVAHGGAAPVADLDQPGLGQPLQRLADGGPGDAQHLGETPLAGQGVTGGQLAVDHLAEELVEDVLGDEPAGYRFQGHAAESARLLIRWSSGQTSMLSNEERARAATRALSLVVRQCSVLSSSPETSCRPSNWWPSAA